MSRLLVDSRNSTYYYSTMSSILVPSYSVQMRRFNQHSFNFGPFQGYDDFNLMFRVFRDLRGLQL